MEGFNCLSSSLLDEVALHPAKRNLTNSSIVSFLHPQYQHMQPTIPLFALTKSKPSKHQLRYLFTAEIWPLSTSLIPKFSERNTCPRAVRERNVGPQTLWDRPLSFTQLKSSLLAISMYTYNIVLTWFYHIYTLLKDNTHFIHTWLGPSLHCPKFPWPAPFWPCSSVGRATVT